MSTNIYCIQLYLVMERKYDSCQDFRNVIRVVIAAVIWRAIGKVVYDRSAAVYLPVTLARVQSLSTEKFVRSLNALFMIRHTARPKYIHILTWHTNWRNKLFFVPIFRVKWILFFKVSHIFKYKRITRIFIRFSIWKYKICLKQWSLNFYSRKIFILHYSILDIELKKWRNSWDTL